MRQLKIDPKITSREDASLDLYLQEIGRIDLITPEKEVALAQKIKGGDQAALEELTKANLRFVVSVAKQYQNQGLALPDLINEGNIGLIKAAQRFDETRGFKFISYAVWWIRQAILQALAEQARAVRLPLNQVTTINKAKKAASRLEQRHERGATPDEIAEALEISTDKVKFALRSGARPVSTDAQLNEENPENFLDTYLVPYQAETDQPSTQESLRIEINRFLKTLLPREAEVIQLFFGLNGYQSHTLEQIGEKFGCKRENVRLIKERAIRRLKHSGRLKLLLLKTYL